MEDLRQAYASVPPVTRSFLLACLLVTLPGIAGIVDLRNFGFFLPYVTSKYEVYRLLTSFLYAGTGLPLLFDLFLFHRTSSALETDKHLLDTASYAWECAVVAVGIQVFNLYLGNWFLFRPFLLALLHLQARHSPNTKVSLFGLITLPSSLYPPALLILDFVQAGPPAFWSGLTGLAVAHAWWFVTEGLPAGRRLEGWGKDGPGWWRRSFGAGGGGGGQGVRTSWGGEVRRPGTQAAGGTSGGGARTGAAASGGGGSGGHQWGGGGNRLGNA